MTNRSERKTPRKRTPLAALAFCAALPTTAAAEKLVCTVDSLLLSNGNSLDAQTAIAIKEEPMLVDIDNGSIQHPIWGTDKFAESELASENLKEGQTVILGHTEPRKSKTIDAAGKDVDFMFDINTESQKIRSFLIAAKTPTDVFAQGHCTQVD